MITRLCVLLCLVPICFIAEAAAQVPQILNYQGRVAVEGVNFDGSGAFRFALVDGAGTTTFWSNDGTSSAGAAPAQSVTLPVVKGLYSVMLGDPSLANMSAIPATAWQHPDVRLRVWFDDGTHGPQLLTPDQRIAAVAYAIVAQDVADGAITAAKIAPGAVGAPQLASNAVQATHVAGGQVVKSVNGLTDAVTLAAGPNVTLAAAGNTVTIGADNPLLTWTGSPNVTTLGTVTTGRWEATPLADAAVASAASWNAKQAGDGTLTLLSGKSATGTGAIVLSTQPTLTRVSLVEPTVAGPTDSFAIGNGYWWTTAVPYLQPNVAGGIAFDIMPRGAAGGDCWIDICSTDVVANPNAFETLSLAKLANGACMIGWNGVGPNAFPRSLHLQTLGGFVGIGQPFQSNYFPKGLVHLAADATTELVLSTAGTSTINAIRAFHSTGTVKAPQATKSGALMLFIGAHGQGTNLTQASADAAIAFRSTEDFTNAAHGTDISIQTTPPGSAQRVERLNVSTDTTVATGNLVIAEAGRGLRYRAGANARAGNVTLVGGSAQVVNTTVTANTLVMVSRRTPGGTLGALSYSVTTNAGANNGFTITSSSAAETSIVSYHLIEAN